MRVGAQDRRVKRTQRVLAQALIELTLEKGYEAVSIRDVTERADVGYATFFRHYSDKDALLHEVLAVVLDELSRLLQLQQNAADPAAVGTTLFRYVQAHSEVCRVLLHSPGSLRLVEQMIEAGTRSVMEQHTAKPGSSVPLELAAHHLVASSINLIQWWLDHSMPYPAEHMGEIYQQLIVQPTHAVAFSS